MKRCLTLAALILMVALPARAQQGIERELGYMDLNEVESWFNEEPKVEVNVYGSLLRLVAQASRNEDPELASLLSRLKGVYVRSYPLRRSDVASLERRMGELSKQVQGRGWETVAKVREDGERVEMFMRTNGDAIAGLLVMAMDADEDETVFVNIVGDIDPEDLGRIGSKFQIDVLQSENVGRRQR